MLYILDIWKILCLLLNRWQFSKKTILDQSCVEHCDLEGGEMRMEEGLKPAADKTAAEMQTPAGGLSVCLSVCLPVPVRLLSFCHSM